MRIETAHNLFRIHNLKTFAREVPIEGEFQIVQITKLFVDDVPAIVDDLMELEVWRSGKVPERFAKETVGIPVRLREPRHTNVSLRTIPD